MATSVINKPYNSSIPSSVVEWTLESGVSAPNHYVIKSGKVAIIEIRATLNTAITTGETIQIGTLPIGYYPARYTPTIIGVGSDHYSVKDYASLNLDNGTGTIKVIYNGSATNIKSIIGYVAFICST